MTSPIKKYVEPDLTPASEIFFRPVRPARQSTCFYRRKQIHTSLFSRRYL